MAPELRPDARADTPLPIGFGKTFAQPFIVAMMIDPIAQRRTDRLLEIVIGQGCQPVFLAEFALPVCSSVLPTEALAWQARRQPARRGCAGTGIKVGSGWRGRPEHAPFDKVLGAAPAEPIAPSLFDWLTPDLKVVTPAGLSGAQQRILADKDTKGSESSREIAVASSSLLDDDRRAAQQTRKPAASSANRPCPGATRPAACHPACAARVR